MWLFQSLCSASDVTDFFFDDRERSVEEFKKRCSINQVSADYANSIVFSKNVICSTSLFSCPFSVELSDVFDSHESRFRLPLGMRIL